MQSVLNNIFQIIVMNGVVMIIPGVNFLLVARQSIVNGVQAGFFCACGITTALLSHSLLAALSVSILITKFPFVFACIRYIGAAYLCYLGSSFIIRAIQNKGISLEDRLAMRHASFRSGFFVDLLNPYISIFYLTLFSSMNFGQNKILELSSYLLTIFIMSLSWFSIVAVFFNQSLIRETLKSKTRYIQALSGLAMYYFSAKVIFQF